MSEDAIAAGRVAFLVVAGGQGTRLGFDHPKGMFPIGPISKKTLFQLHAEKVLELHRRWGVAIPLLVMTSPATDGATRSYFKRKNYRGALERYKDALTYKPNDAVANFRMAQCDEKLGNSSDAVQHYQAYLSILPHGPFAADAQESLIRLKSTARK